MGWTPAGSLAQSPGQGDSNSSLPVALSHEQEALLNEIQTSVQALATARGIAADLRVTVLSGIINTITTLSALTSVNQVAGVPANTSVFNWTNQTFTQAFTNNVKRT